MNRLVRIAASLAVVAVVVAAAAATTLWAYRVRVTAWVLAQIDERTGLAVDPQTTAIQFGRHLYVFLDDVVVSRGGQKISEMKSIRATVGYHSIATASGLPLNAIRVESPTFYVGTPDAGAVPMPRPESAAIERVTRALATLSRTARRVDVIDAKVVAADGGVIADSIEMSAFTKRTEPERWHVGFSADFHSLGFEKMKVAAKLNLGHAQGNATAEAGDARIWIWNWPIRGVKAEGLELGGDLQTMTALKIHDDGSISGISDVDAHQVAVSGASVKAPIELGEYSAHAEFSIAQKVCTVSALTLKRVDTTMLSATSVVQEPFGPNPKVSVTIANLEMELVRLKQQILSWRKLPVNVAEWIRRVGSGALKITDVTASAPLGDLANLSLENIARNASFTVTLQDAQFTLPAETKLPPISAIDASINYQRGAFSVAQGSARVGASAVHDISFKTDASKGLEGAPYSLNFQAEANLDELNPAVGNLLNLVSVPNRDHLQKLGGIVDVRAKLSGVLSPAKPVPPTDYQIDAEANGAMVMIAGAPGPVQFRRGAIAITPRAVTFKNLLLATTGGDARINGVVDIAKGGMALRNVDVDFHNMPSESWIGLVMDPSDLGLRGSTGGRLVLNGDPRVRGDLTGEGKLTISSGAVQFNFLRAPVDVQVLTIELHKKRMTATMPAAKLEGSPIDWRLTVPDIDHPSVLMDVNVQKLDLEVLKFIRMPWSPATTPIHFPIPTSGHIDARQAHLAALPMDHTSVDFLREANGDWRVSNLRADTFGGKMDGDIRGRGPDNWIEMKGKVANLDAASIFLMDKTRTEPPLTGKVSAAFDLWGNTDTNFYDTLAGNISLTVRDGVLNKFTLLSRMLGVVDLKNYLTANVQDPRNSGLPFDKVIADFKGKNGLMYTDNFVLNGPVMDITAAGNVQMGEGTIDLHVALLPFDTVDWALNHIPLIGKRLGSGTGKFVAAYFHVTGPVGDPSVIPNPLASVGEFVKKTLGLPINLIRPNTIK